MIELRDVVVRRKDRFLTFRRHVAIVSRFDEVGHTPAHICTSLKGTTKNSPTDVERAFTASTAPLIRWNPERSPVAHFDSVDRVVPATSSGRRTIRSAE